MRGFEAGDPGTAAPESRGLGTPVTGLVLGTGSGLLCRWFFDAEPEGEGFAIGSNSARYWTGSAARSGGSSTASVRRSAASAPKSGRNRRDPGDDPVSYGELERRIVDLETRLDDLPTAFER